LDLIWNRGCITTSTSKTSCSQLYHQHKCLYNTCKTQVFTICSNVYHQIQIHNHHKLDITGRLY